MKLIPLTQGRFVMVDDLDYGYLNQFKWYAYCQHGIWYAARQVRYRPKHKTTQHMHHLVIGVLRLPKMLGLVTDHIDGNGLNNKRNNLRVVSNSKNLSNQDGHRKGTLLGVHKRSCSNLSKPWETRIRVNNKQVILGYFEAKEEAH